MATFSVTTTDLQDTAIQYVTTKWNEANGAALTPLAFARHHIDHLFDGWVSRYQAETSVTKGELYQRATPEDQLLIDSILDKYR
ncbi:MAG TPA: hypothetical protein VEI97_08625 [bacterium]|nr:hypothetical protein [bacterium]